MLNEDVWPSSFDDREIDDIIWSEIKDSTSRGDFISYLIHRPQKGRHRYEAQARLEAMEGSDSIPVGYARAVARIHELAERGDAGAMFHVGKLHVLGIGLQQDMRAAETWYHKAIAKGEVRAYCNMGWIYLYGFAEIPPNKEQAFRLLSVGAEQGVSSAKASIGLMWITGDGRVANPVLGLKLLAEAFGEGYNNAANHLWDIYFTGVYVPRNVEVAHDWLFKLVARGDERTMAILGHYLVTGSHGKTDVAQGLSLLHQAIEKNYVPAYLWLGNLYRHGQGVERDLAKAREWYEQGDEAGNTGCAPALASMMLEINPAPATGTPSLH
jgi:TPR repeat protein